MRPGTNQTLLTIRIIFFLICMLGAALISFVEDEWSRSSIFLFATCLAGLVILVDIYLRGFSIRGLTALTFGIAIGSVIALLIDVSPLFDPLKDDPSLSGNLFIIRLILFVVLMYWGAVLALRGKDDFNLLIPYVKFVPETLENQAVLVDSSALIDGRVVAIAESHWIGPRLLIPRFILREVQNIADSSDQNRRAKGRQGLDVLNSLRSMPHLDITIHESEVVEEDEVDNKLLYLARTLKAKLLTTDFNLARRAQFEGVDWLNISALAKALNPPIRIGLQIEIDLIKPGKDPDQAVGYLNDGSMVVVNNGRNFIGETVPVEVISIIPTTGGRMVFADVHTR